MTTSPSPRSFGSPISEPPREFATAAGIAAAVASGETSAAAVIETTLARIEALDAVVNAFTDVTAERARAEAARIDADRARGLPLGPLAGVPFAAKNLFDISGLPTRAGSRINRERAPAARDGLLVARMRAAGAILVGALNMGEYAYDFTGENAHDGPCRNPHDPGRMSGGSSSGCGGATAAGLAPISLGSDTNGSLRVPASLCGVLSLKPTYGRLGRSGTFPFVDSLDHLGPFARCVTDLALAYDALQGPDPADHACAGRPVAAVTPDLGAGVAGVRVARLGGWFAERAGPEARAAVARVLDGLAARGAVPGEAELPGAEAGRAAAYLITNSESAAFHLPRLRARPMDYDPDTRDRFLAGALLPAAWIARAQATRRAWLEQALEAFAGADLLIAPATPCPAPLRGQKALTIEGREYPLRPSLGLLAQPFSAIGLPVATVPVFNEGELPIGVQIIAAPWREDLALRAAAALEAAGVSRAHPPAL